MGAHATFHEHAFLAGREGDRACASASLPCSTTKPQEALTAIAAPGLPAAAQACLSGAIALNLHRAAWERSRNAVFGRFPTDFESVSGLRRTAPEVP